MPNPSPKPITQLHFEWRNGNPQALDQLLVYDELRRLARHYLKSEPAFQTLQAAALVNEAYIRLVGMDVPCQDRAHFFAVAARLLSEYSSITRGLIATPSAEAVRSELR